MSVIPYTTLFCLGTFLVAGGMFEKETGKILYPDFMRSMCSVITKGFSQYNWYYLPEARYFLNILQNASSYCKKKKKIGPL